MKKTQRQKWQIISLIGIKKNEVRNIKFKVEDLVRHCEGFIFSCNEAGTPKTKFSMGEISLFINNRKSHPLNYMISSMPAQLLKRKIETLKFGECIEGGSFVHGYYRDLGLSPTYPYNLKIYLDCIADNG
jgi:hypothetical protein